MNSRIALATDRAEERGMDKGSGVHGAGAEIPTPWIASRHPRCVECFN